MINKVVDSIDEAVADIPDGATIAVGGFVGVPGVASNLVKAVGKLGPKGLTVISCEGGRGHGGGFLPRNFRGEAPPMQPIPEDGIYPAGHLSELGLVKKAITTFASTQSPGNDGPLEARARAGEAEIELIGQGSLMERLRCGRVGIAGFYTPVGAGTYMGIGKDVRYFDGVPHVLETALKPDFALICAHQADRYGNLTYSYGARTTNPVFAGSATVTIVEVDEIVPVGAIHPDHVMTPGPYVQRVVLKPGGRIVE